ncbi:MAG: hypothetical protein FWD78_14650 [Treponema sp.]|nr:hypothetical protein [Treponema sp.]
METGKNIRGLDLESGLTSINWDFETWLKVTETFIQTTPVLLEKIGQVNPINLSEYTIIVHGIKSVCYSIGAANAGNMARELEEQSRSGNFGLIAKKNLEFITIIANLLNDLSVLMGKYGEQFKKPLKDKPDDNILREIIGFSRDYDINNLESAITELEKYSYTEGGELVRWLRTQCNDSGFAAIQEELAKIQK